MSNPEHEASILIIEGRPVQHEDMLSISAHLGTLGLRGVFIDERAFSQMNLDGTPLTQPELIRRNGYRFEDITSPEHIVVREHFDDLARHCELPKINFARAFHHIVDGTSITPLSEPNPDYRRSTGSLLRRQTREPTPLRGIQLVKRTDYGFDPYSGNRLVDHDSQVLASYGITAESLAVGLQWTLLLTSRRLPRNVSVMQEVTSVLHSRFFE